MTADFSSETTEERREWHDIFQVLKEKNPQPVNFRFNATSLYRDEEEIKIFSN